MGLMAVILLIVLALFITICGMIIEHGPRVIVECVELLYMYRTRGLDGVYLYIMHS